MRIRNKIRKKMLSTIMFALQLCLPFRSAMGRSSVVVLGT